MYQPVPEPYATQALNLQCGTRKRVKHCRADNSMLLSHDLKGISAHCFRCGPIGFTPHGHQSIQDIVRRTAEYQAALAADAKLALPDDYTQDVPLQYATWYMSKGISYELAKYHGFGFSPSLMRVIMPVYEPSVHRDVAGRILTNVQARAVVDGMKPKYLTPGANEFPSAIFWGDNSWAASTVIVTEDILSSVKVGQWYHTCSILGTNMNDGRAAKIAARYKRAFIWLDPDKAGISGSERAARKLALVGVDAKVVRADKDPKFYTKKQTQEILGALMND